MSYIQPNKLFQVPIVGGELTISPAFDFIHHFGPLGAHILRYWDSDNKTLHDIPLSAEAAGFLVAKCELEVVERVRIYEAENNNIVDYRAKYLSEEDFGL